MGFLWDLNQNTQVINVGMLVLQWGTNGLPASGFHCKEDVCFGLNWHRFHCFSFSFKKKKKKKSYSFTVQDVMQLSALIPSPPRDKVMTFIRYVIKLLHASALLMVQILRRYNSSLGVKLHSEWHLSLGSDRSRALWYCIASTLLALWHLCGVSGKQKGDLRIHSAPDSAPPPFDSAQCHYAANTSNYMGLCGACSS